MVKVRDSVVQGFLYQLKFLVSNDFFIPVECRIDMDGHQTLP